MDMPKPPSELPELQLIPDPELDRRQRRRFSPEDKLRILELADACRQRGELAALLRRERIYSSQLQTWRRQFQSQGEGGLANRRAGRTATKDHKDRRIEALERERAQLQKRLRLAEDLLCLQKKAMSLLDQIQDDEKH